MEPTKKSDKPYKPSYSGFDVERTEKAQATNERAQETAGAKGEDANREYLEEGPKEHKRRLGEETD